MSSSEQFLWAANLRDMLDELRERKDGIEEEAHTCSAAPAAEAELQSSSDPALPSAHHPLPQPAALYQSWRNICD